MDSAEWFQGGGCQCFGLGHSFGAFQAVWQEDICQSPTEFLNRAKALPLPESASSFWNQPFGLFMAYFLLFFFHSRKEAVLRMVRSIYFMLIYLEKSFELINFLTTSLLYHDNPLQMFLALEVFNLLFSSENFLWHFYKYFQEKMPNVSIIALFPLFSSRIDLAGNSTSVISLLPWSKHVTT